jgi:FkbM family methyltransferase
MSIRSLAESLTRPLVFTRRLPEIFGHSKIVVTPAAGLKFLRWNLGNADQMIVRFISDFVSSSDVVWDIGANCGLFSVPAAHRTNSSGFVLSVEPDLELIALLRRSQRLNQFEHMVIVPTAVGEAVKTCTFKIARHSRAESYVLDEGLPGYGGCAEAQTTLCLTLDFLLNLYTSPTILKIDVEGAEYLVLSGAERILAESRPLILIELSQMASEVRQVLTNANYALHDVPSRSSTVVHDTRDIVAVPTEKLNRYERALSGYPKFT